MCLITDIFIQIIVDAQKIENIEDFYISKIKDYIFYLKFILILKNNSIMKIFSILIVTIFFI